MSEIKNRCYYCGKPKTSMEHVPPKVFFPDKKYRLNNTDYRKNLITVPSCDEHNSAKSNLDELLFTVITMSASSNKYGQYLFSEKAVDKVVFRSHHIFNSIFNSTKSALISRDQEKSSKPTLICNIDKNKLDDCFTHIAKGIYFYHFKQVYTHSIEIHYQFQIFTSANTEKMNYELEEINRSINKMLSAIEKHGENPDIFYYKILEEKPETLLLQLSFYEFTKVDIFFNRTNKNDS